MIERTFTFSSLIGGRVVALGRQMEDNYRSVTFDCSEFDEPISTITLVHQRSNDVAPYIVGSATANTLTWTVTNTDTAYYGYGVAELRITFESGLAKSVTGCSIRTNCTSAFRATRRRVTGHRTWRYLFGLRWQTLP